MRDDADALGWAGSDPAWVSSFEVERRVLAECRERPERPPRRRFRRSPAAVALASALVLAPIGAGTVLALTPEVGASALVSGVPVTVPADVAVPVSGGLLLVSAALAAWAIGDWLREGRSRRAADPVALSFVAVGAVFALLLFPRVGGGGAWAGVAGGVLAMAVLGLVAPLLFSTSTPRPREVPPEFGVDPAQISSAETQRLLALRREVVAELVRRGLVDAAAQRAAQEFPLGEFPDYTLPRTT